MVSIHKIWKGRFDLHALTLSNYSFILTKYEAARTAIWNSCILGFGAATVGMFLCVVLVYVLIRTKLKGRIVLDFISSLPIGIPGLSLRWEY